MQQTIEIHLPRLHSGQKTVKDSPARFKVLAAGRRWGKTRLGSLLCIDAALNGGRAWWVAPSYKVARVGWRGIYQLADQIPGSTKHRGDRIVTMPKGGFVQVRSADEPDSLRGEGLDLVVADEAAFIKEAAWLEALRPALTDRKGSALIISTPKGRNWFWRAYQRGLSGDDPEWMSWKLPSRTNPFLDPAEIDSARRELPENIFRQEYLAEFLEDAGAVFRNIRTCISPYPHVAPLGSNRYVMGVDWALVTDFTVLIVIDATTKQVVDIDRFNQIDWPFQRDRLIAMANKWRVKTILAEHNSIGGPNISELNRVQMPVRAFETNNQSKADVIQALAVAFEQGEIGIPDNPILIGELEAFEATRLPSGKWHYAAPDGMHDDMVIALALAWEAANSQPSVARVQVSGLYSSRGRR